MKSFSVILICIIQCLSFSLFAQENRHLEIGLHGGVGGFWFRGSPALKEFNPWWADAAGLTVKQDLNPWLSLQAEINWERQYKKIEGTWTTETGEYGGKFINKSYGEWTSFPVLAHFSVGNKVKYYANVGPLAKYWLADHGVSRFNGQTERYKFEIWNGTNRLQLGAAMGLGVALPVSEQFVLSLEIRDHLGLTRYEKEKPLFSSRHNNTIYIMPALMYKIR